MNGPYVTSPVNSVHGPPEGCTCVWLEAGRNGDWDLIAELDDCPTHSTHGGEES